MAETSTTPLDQVFSIENTHGAVGYSESRPARGHGVVTPG